MFKACPRFSKETEKLAKGNVFYNSDSSCKGKKNIGSVRSVGLEATWNGVA